jgi:hypothetical protein
MGGYLVAPVDGDYVFYVASDDDSQLLLDGVVVAYVQDWTGYQQWTNGNVHPSEPITLTAGQLMTLDYGFREGGGGDFFSIGWKLPGSDVITLVPDAFTIPDEAGLALPLGLTPLNGTTGVIDAVVSWMAPPAGAVAYDILFGTDPDNLDKVAEGVTETSYNLGSVPTELAFGTTYYWGVMADGGTTVSSFTTVDPVVIISATGDAQKVGAAAKLEVVAESPVGAALTYQWHRMNFSPAPGVVLPDVPIPGAESSVYAVAAIAASDQGDYYCVVSSPDGEVASPVVFLDCQTGLIHRWTFNESADGVTIPDVVGGGNATLVNTTGLATIADGQATLGNDGSQSSSGAGGGATNGDYVDLPNDLVSPLTQMTIECWTTWNDDTQGWARAYDFGTSNQGEDLSGAADGAGVHTFYFTPRTGYNQNAILEYRLGGTAPNIQPGGKLPLGEEVLITQVTDDKADKVKLYLNGIALGGFSAPLFKLKDMVDNNNWLGRSQWGDPMYVGSFNELRIYDTALSAEAIAADYLAGPDELGVLPAKSTGPVLLGDLNGDGVYDLLDVAIAADKWLSDSLNKAVQIADLQAAQ